MNETQNFLLYNLWWIVFWSNQNDERLDELFVSDRNSSNPGVRIYDPGTGALLAGPLNTGLPPFDITLLDESISREHAIILLDQATQTYTIEDLQSTNSTKVNGKRIRSAELSPGDEIEIGRTRFRFLIE